MWVLLVCVQLVLQAVALRGEGNICTVCRCSAQEGDVTAIPETRIDCSFLNFDTVLEDASLPIFSFSLNFNHNNLSIISKELFPERNPLKTLSISYNNLREISERAFDSFNNLKSLDLSHNNLTVLARHLFDAQVLLEHLDLSSNNLTEVPEDLFENNVNLRVLSLSHNKLLGSTIRNNHLRSAFNHGLKTLYLQDVGLRVVPSELFNGATNLTELFLDENPLNEVPEMFVPSLRTLSLSGSLASKVPAGAFVFAPGLRRLHMDDCQALEEVHENAFVGLADLQTLSLRRCSRLARWAAALPPSVLHLSVAWSGLRSLQPTVLQHLNLSGSLDLSGNLWNCDCHLAWLRHFTQAHHVRCFLPPRLRGHLLHETKPADLGCSSVSRHIAVNVLAVVAVLVFLALISVITFRKYGQTLVSLWRPRTTATHYGRVRD